MAKIEPDFLQHYTEHLRTHGAARWKLLQEKFPDMASATFWRRCKAAETFLIQVKIGNPDTRSVCEAGQDVNVPINSSSQIAESSMPLDPDDPSTMVERLLLMAQNLENSSIVVLDGKPRIADAQRYAIAARLIAEAARLKLATWRT